MTNEPLLSTLYSRKAEPLVTADDLKFWSDDWNNYAGSKWTREQFIAYHLNQKAQQRNQQVISQVEAIVKTLQEKKKRYNSEYAKGMNSIDTSYFGGREDSYDEALDLLGTIKQNAS